MKITLELTEIDYGALAEQFLPLVRDKLAEKDGTIAGLLAKVAGMPPNIVGRMVDILPQESKDEIAVMLVNKSKDKIISMITKYAKKNGVSFEIMQFDVE